jgi:hypothetical protein
MVDIPKDPSVHIRLWLACYHPGEKIGGKRHSPRVLAACSGADVPSMQRAWCVMNSKGYGYDLGTDIVELQSMDRNEHYCHGRFSIRQKDRWKTDGRCSG